MKELEDNLEKDPKNKTTTKNKIKKLKSKISKLKSLEIKSCKRGINYKCDKVRKEVEHEVKV